MMKTLTMPTEVDGIRQTQIVAIHRRELVGRVAYQATDGLTASFCQLYVRNGYRRVGVASRLVQCCAELALCDRRTELRLKVQETNKDAIALYQDLGFRIHFKCNDGDLAMGCQVDSLIH